MNSIFLNNIGDLVEAQRASFYQFLSFGIKEEFSTFPNPFIAKMKGFGKRQLPSLIYFYPNEMKFKGPSWSVENCLRKNTTYSLQLYIPSEYSPSKELKGEKLPLSSQFLENCLFISL